MATRRIQRTHRSECDLADKQGERANGDTDSKRADDARSAVKGRHASREAD